MIFAVLFSRYRWFKFLFFLCAAGVVGFALLGFLSTWAREYRITVGISAAGFVILVMALGGIYLYLRDARIRKTGTKAAAKVISVHDTGWFEGPKAQRSVLRIRLEVHPESAAPYQTDLFGEFTSADLLRLQPGTFISIKYDPDKPENVVLDGSGDAPSGAPASGGATTHAAGGADDAMMEMLLKRNALNAALLATGASAEATIVKSWDLGVQIDGDNPVMGFLLEVEPHAQQSFTAEAQGPVMRASLHKYRIGNKVKVRYDADNHEKIMIERAL